MMRLFAPIFRPAKVKPFGWIFGQIPAVFYLKWASCEALVRQETRSATKTQKANSICWLSNIQYRHTYYYSHTYIHAYTYIRIHSCIHTHIRTYIHTHIRTYIYTYTHTYQNGLILSMPDCILHGREQPFLTTLAEKPKSPHNITILL